LTHRRRRRGGPGDLGAEAIGRAVKTTQAVPMDQPVKQCALSNPSALGDGLGVAFFGKAF